MSEGESDDVEALAAEYVIGTLDRGEREAFAARIGVDDAAHRAVLSWERRLAPLQKAIDAVPPPANLWSRIERALDEGRTPASTVIAGGRDAGRRTLAGTTALRRSRDIWRFGAIALGGLAAVLAIFVAVDEVSRTDRADMGATYVAAVNRGGDKPALIVSVNMRTRTVLVRPVAAHAPAGHSLELWYIGDGGAPRSLGLVPNATARIAIPGDARADDAATFAVSVEPPGGSRTGGPTGEVLFSGQLVRD